MNAAFEAFLFSRTGAKAWLSTETIQSLWSGYGAIVRYTLDGGDHPSVVVKCIDTQAPSEHPRGWAGDIGHQRKLKSYQVELAWYQHWRDQANAQCYMPQLLGAFEEAGRQYFILEDLDQRFPLRVQAVRDHHVRACLSWLAHFHARYLGLAPKKLWTIGTYWHLDTRPEEYQAMADGPLKDAAATIDEVLNRAQYQTIVHGDAKLANFCFSADGHQVAAVDFQYVGGGCGMKDVAYFLGSCLHAEECMQYEAQYLDYYFSQLHQALMQHNKEDQHPAIEHEWRALYPYAVADFTRFLLGWMPGHQKVNGYSMLKVREVLAGGSHCPPS